MEELNKVLRNFRGDELARDVFIKKYALKNKDGSLKELSLDDMGDRLANAIIKVENVEHQNVWREKFRKLFKYFIPGGRILYALGNDEDPTATLKNCYVIDIEEDSIAGIFETAKRQAILFSKGGGVGFDVSKLRPKGAPVNNSAKTTTGAVSFMDLYSIVTGLIGQYGRRGALMLTMDCFAKNTYVYAKKEDELLNWYRIDNLVEDIRKNKKKYKAWTENGLFDITDTQIIEDRQVYEIETENGKKITVTGDHKFVVKNIITNKEYLKSLLDINPEEEELVLFE